MRRFTATILLAGTFSLAYSQTPEQQYPQGSGGFGCVDATQRVRQVLLDPSVKVGENKVYSCCGGMKLMVNVKMNENQKAIAADWQVIDSQGTKLTTEQREGKKAMSYRAPREIQVLKVILGKGPDKRIKACFFVETRPREKS